MKNVSEIQKFDYLVYIMRAQPLHNGHLFVIREALKNAAKLIILIGSANSARNTRNPFTFEERVTMLYGAFTDDEISRVILAPVNDYPYNDNQWVTEVQKSVYDITEETASIGLIGYAKDHTSYYLNMFPTWGSVDIKTQFSTLNSSDIRKEYFKEFYRIPDEEHCPISVIKFMKKFVKTAEFQWLVAENKFNMNYDPKKYDNDIVACVDAVVVQAGHILLIRRKNHPGKGLWALPGGHVEKKETYINAVIRELKEETHIADKKGEIPPAILKSFITRKELFDDPHRSLRARVTSMAYLFELPKCMKLFHVKGDDDAEFAQWVPLGNLNSNDFFEDHYAIITEMTGVVID